MPWVYRDSAANTALDEKRDVAMGKWPVRPSTSSRSTTPGPQGARKPQQIAQIPRRQKHSTSANPARRMAASSASSGK